MLSGRRQKEKRDKEYQVRGDVFVLLKSNGINLVGSMREISLNGLSFHYIGKEKVLSKEGELAICSGGKDFFLYRVPCTILFDSKVYKNHPSPISMRRCGVEFGELDDKRMTQIEYFIQKHTHNEKEAMTPNG
jgi:hypothetical protein